jgi:hypothetical protein
MAASGGAQAGGGVAGAGATMSQPSCSDDMQNGDETDVDCGGGCPACADGLGCMAAGDCDSGVCTGAVCQLPACDDGVNNGSESDVDCGGACVGCGAGKNCGSGGDCLSTVCDAAVCTHPELGTGKDGALTVSAPGNQIVNSYTHLSIDVAAGAMQLPVGSEIGFAAGDEVLVIQSQGQAAGSYEFSLVQSVAAGTLNLANALVSSYQSGTYDVVGSEVAQVVRVPQYTTVTVSADASIVAKLWDGKSGGIVIFRALSALQVSGAIDASARGYRGPWGTTNMNEYHHTGEGTLGGSPQQSAENKQGGGGAGFRDNVGSYHGGFGGGCHATAGSDGQCNTNNCSVAVGGSGATSIYGSADLSTMFFGGAGSRRGGGIVYVVAGTVSVNAGGKIEARGGDGSCRSNTWGNGESGGAGGTIWLRAKTLTLGTSLVRADGGVEVSQGDCGGKSGGGGDGRIRLDGNVITGSTIPAAGKTTSFD